MKFQLPGHWDILSRPWYWGVLQVQPNGGTLELELEDAHFMIGSVGVDVEFSPTVSAFFNAEAAAPQNILVLTDQDTLGGAMLAGPGTAYAVDPIRWKGTRLEYWSVDGGLTYRLGDLLSLVGGFKMEQLSLRLAEPRDAEGRPLSFYMSYTVFFVTVDRTHEVGGDFRAKLWTPYIGLILDGANFHGTLLWSPLAYGTILAPLHATGAVGIRIGQPISGSLDVGLDWRFKALGMGTYLEARLEYENEVTRKFAIKLWGRGRLFSIGGPGSLDTEADHVGTGFLAPFAYGVRPESGAGRATYITSSLAAGISAHLTF